MLEVVDGRCFYVLWLAIMDLYFSSRGWAKEMMLTRKASTRRALIQPAVSPVTSFDLFFVFCGGSLEMNLPGFSASAGRFHVRQLASANLAETVRLLLQLKTSSSVARCTGSRLRCGLPIRRTGHFFLVDQNQNVI